MKVDDMPERQPQEEITLQQLIRWQEELNQLYQQNINLRMKYPTDPMKFYQSEQSIDSLLQKLQQLGQQHIPLIIQSNILHPILKILNHPNSDINMQCIQFLHQMISQEPTNDQIYQVFYRMCIWLIQNGLFQSLTQTILKMQEQESVEQYQIALKILKIVQTLVELWDSSVQTLVAETKLLDYLANRIMPNFKIKHKVLDDNKFVSSDLLAVILSHSLPAQIKFHKLCGVEIILESVRPYLSHSPASSDQQEYLGNLFDCLNILLINPSPELQSSRRVYQEMKGNQVMLQFVRAKNEYSISALKSIAASLVNNPEDETSLVEELIDWGALKYIFPIILRQGVKGADIDQQRSIDQNCLSIVYCMLRSSSEVYRMRIQAKLTEKRFGKLQKLFEIRGEFLQNIGKEAETQPTPQQYLDRIKQGLTVVETIDKILCLLVMSTSTVKDRMISLMRIFGVWGKEIEMVLSTCYKYATEGYERDILSRLLANEVQLLMELTFRNGE